MDPENTIEAGSTVEQEEPEPQPQLQEQPPESPQRSFIAEWAVTIILLLFGTTFLIQAYVIPTGSMEDTLLVGDHLLVDKLCLLYTSEIPHREARQRVSFHQSLLGRWNVGI